MKKALINILFFILTSNIASANRIEKFYKDLKIDGLSFLANKRSILKTFGRPEKEFKPKYECGFLSEAEQNQPFTSLKYKLITWTGTEREGYILEQLKLTLDLKNRISYKGHIISSQTTQVEFTKLSGLKPDKTNSISISYPRSDDRYIFHFSNGKLREIEYWSPC